MHGGVSGYVVCLMRLYSNRTICGMCVVLDFPMFEYIYMEGGRGPYIWGQSPAGG
jgi:hypothetical protein